MVVTLWMPNEDDTEPFTPLLYGVLPPSVPQPAPLVCPFCSGTEGLRDDTWALCLKCGAEWGLADDNPA